MICKYCDKPVEPSAAAKGSKVCGKCRDKKHLVHRFVEVCDELKRKLGVPPRGSE